MDLNRISVFAAVVAAQSFTKAAQTLGLPKSSVSRRVTELEAELGVRLLERTTRTLHLTDAGRRFHEQVARNLEAIAEAASQARDARSAPRGIIRVTTTSDFGAVILPCLVAGFTAQYPEVSVYVELTNRRVDLVGEGVDLAIRFGSLSDSSLIVRRVGAIENRLVASPKYLEKHGTPRRLSQLDRHECLLFRPQAGPQKWTLTGPHGSETVTVNGRCAGDDFGYLLGLTRQHHGIALLPWFLAQPFVASEELTAILPKHAQTGADGSIVYPAARYQPERVRLFVEFLLERLRKVAWRRGD